ncbi:type IV secretion system protein [Bartonella sp. MM73XJBT.G]|uniref:type IV secretion system protein n=1 Tax=Bartonella sp. MM73XJBT.G TaxID=3019097 RepID=UPI002360839D|nr:type IV secretion system protein [Bartonella sp. MM73XJBT.G]
MKKQFVITGIIVLLAMLNLTRSNAEVKVVFEPAPTPSPSFPTQTPSSPLSLDYTKITEIIDLLKKQIEENEKQIKKTQEINQSITGNRIQKPTIGEKPAQNTAGQKKDKSFFLEDSYFIYPTPRRYYTGIHHGVLETSILTINKEEKRIGYWTPRILHSAISKRLKYNAIVAKAVSLQAIQEAEKRFTYILDLVNNINKTKDLREVSELQTRIRNMSAMLQNEFAKLEMVKSLSNDEMALIDIQKRKRYGFIVDHKNKNMVSIRF